MAPEFLRRLTDPEVRVQMTVAALGSIAAALFAYWFLPSHNSPVLPPIVVSPVQNAQQTVQVIVPGAGVTPAAAAPPSTAPAVEPTAFVNRAAMDSGDRLVLILGQDGSIESELTARASDALRANGGALTGDFVRRGFARAYDGDPSELAGVAGIARVPLIALGRMRASYAANDSVAAGMRQANVDLDLRVYRPAAGFTTDLVHVAAVGAGHSEREALSEAFARAGDQLTSKIAP
jgi:hypothetical protein